MGKKVLLISRKFFPTSSPRAFRTTELATELASMKGFEVEVLLPSYYNTKDTLAYAERNHIQLSFFGPPDWRWIERRKYKNKLEKYLRIALYLLFEYPNILIYFRLKKYLKTVQKKYDLLITIAVPHEIHWAVARRRKKKRIVSTWIADCGDPFMRNGAKRFTPPFYFYFYENAFLKRADYITVPIQGAIAAYRAKYRDKFVVIPQGFSFENIHLSEYKEEKGKLRFAYAGGVSTKGIRSPFALIEYLKDKKEIDFEFHVFSKGVALLKQEAEALEGKLILHEAVPRRELLKELSKMDFLINFDNGFPTALPSKLIDYAIAMRPILSISPEQPEQEKIDAFLEKDYQQQLRVENVERYNIRNVVRQFLDLMG